MDTKTIRRLQLLHVIEEIFDGERGRCADALKMKRPQLSRWITANEKARQGISEDSARYIEVTLGLPKGALDDDHKKIIKMQPTNRTIDPVVADFEWTYNNATSQGKKFLVNAVHAAKLAYIDDKKGKQNKA